VVDLAQGHIKALQALTTPQCTAINLGTGVGYSVLEVIHAFERASNQPIPYTLAPRREGDIATCYADPTLAQTLLGWKAHHTLETMCRDAWNFQSKNPSGYEKLVIIP